MTRHNRNIPLKIRREIFDRDKDKCVKCGHKKNLELHHILPVYLGGIETPSNLISLCHTCHKEAPDDPILFFKWAITSLPPKLDESLKLTKICLGILTHNEKMMTEMKKLKEWTKEQGDFEYNPVFLWIESFYKDMWKVFVSNDMNNLCMFLEGILPKSEQNKDNFPREDNLDVRKV